MLSWLDDLEGILDGIGESATLAQAAVGSSVGPLSEPARSEVLADLENALELINEALESGALPVPEPGEAILTAIQPLTLADYAGVCTVLAEEALDELQAAGEDLDEAYITARLKTIAHLITRTSPHNYRTKVGGNH